jgi:hypothetical protein
MHTIIFSPCRHWLGRNRPFLALTLFLLGWPLLAQAERGARQTHPDLRFEFALIGDTPYNEDQRTNLFPNMIRELNRAKLAFVVHDGDIKSGDSACIDTLFEERFRQFQTFRHPLIYLFGDNEWTDCGRSKEQAFDPVERLQRLRSIFTAGHRSLGQRTLTLERQSDQPSYQTYRENVRWSHGNILFVGLNVPGSDNNVGKPEFGPRNQANLAWIKQSFELAAAENYRAVLFILQANPYFEVPANNPKRAGFNDMLKLFETETLRFGRQVVFVHGDTHYFRIDQPLLSSVSKRRIENFTRVETYGNPDVHWVRVRVDWRDPNVFTFHPMLVKDNLVHHAIPAPN